MIEAIIFDCDGVILESNDIKTEAFRELFAEYPEYQDAIVDYHLNNRGVSRFEKFRYIYKHYFKRPLYEDEMKALCEQFSRIVYDKIVRCPMVEGAELFLKRYYCMLKLFVISATPEDEMQAIFSDRGISKYFSGIYGSPTKKSARIDMILNEYSFSKDEAIFVGDSLSDYENAREAGVKFVMRLSDREIKIISCPDNVDSVKNLVELEGWVRRNGYHGDVPLRL